MPTITDTPVQVASDPQYRMNSTELGPFIFEIGSDTYQVLVAAQDNISTHTVGVFKRATSDVNGSWTQLDSGNQPNPGNQDAAVQSTYNSVRGKIAVVYVSGASAGFTLAEFDIATGLWGTPSLQFTVSLGVFSFTFNALSSGVYRVVYLDGSNLSYVDNTAGTWGSGNVLAGGGIVPLGGPIDSSDNIYIITSEGSFLLNLRILTVGGSLGGAILIHNAVHYASSGRGPNSVLWVSGDAIAVGYFPSGGTHAGDAVISIGTPLASPVFTAYDLFATTATDDVTYINPAVSRDGLTLNGFFVHSDVTTTPLIAEIRQSVFDGISSWSASTLYYDEITNPPPDGTVGVNQFLHAMQLIELPQGWSGAVTMETDNGSPPLSRWCTGFFMEPPGSSPSPPTPACPITPGGSGNVGVSFTATITASGGTPPYTFSIIGGSLPPGLTLDASTGVISGTPTTAGTYAYTVQVTGS